MLYDNAQLLETYADAYEKTKKPLYRRVLRETLDYLKREMTSHEGGFYSALDADSEGEEGRFYVWTKKELESALKDVPDAALFSKIYGLDGEPNFEEKYYILRLEKPLAEYAKEQKLTLEALLAKLEPIQKRLFDIRAKRERPFLDTKILTAWNGEMIAGFARAGQALDDKQAIAAARKAAEFILAKMRTKEGRLLRTYGAAPGEKAQAKLNGYLDDYAYLVHGLLTLHDVTEEARWLTEAKSLTDTMLKFHLDEKKGGLYYTSHDHEKLFARSKDQYDGAQPSGNSIAVRNFVRLMQKTKDERYKKLAKQSFEFFAGMLKASPVGLTTMHEALSMYLNEK